MSSKFIYVVTCVNTSFLNDTPLPIRTIVDYPFIMNLTCLHHLGIVNSASVNIHVYIFYLGIFFFLTLLSVDLALHYFNLLRYSPVIK